MFNISVLLDVQANLPETSLFFVGPNGFSEHLFQMFIVLGMYNFGFGFILVSEKINVVTGPRMKNAQQNPLCILSYEI